MSYIIRTSFDRNRKIKGNRDHKDKPQVMATVIEQIYADFLGLEENALKRGKF